MALPIHRLEWSVHASSVANIEAIADAMSWLIGDDELVDIEMTKSFHTSPMYIITAFATKKSEARVAITRLGPVILTEVADSLEDRIDDENWLHLRIKLVDLVTGNLTLVSPHENVECVKGRMKLEIYPGNDVTEVAKKLLLEGSEVALRRGFPESPIKIENE
ncbi:MAG: hypothetical protein HOE69_06325 [Euryarchaeota archaeon]|jgi:RNA binding exosome subunit|nr:hypothetical protein [Euryarchaeota archaeon]